MSLERFFSARALFFLCGCFIVYATTIPWDVAHAPTLEGVSWIPFWDSHRGRIWSIPDMVQNVLLFIPFGFLGALSSRGQSTFRTVLKYATVGLILSLTVEALQTMSATRSPAATDLATNFAGAAIGAAMGTLYKHRFHDRFLCIVHDLRQSRPGMLVALGLLGVLLFIELAPFLPSLDLDNIKQGIKALIRQPWGNKPAGAHLFPVLLYAGATFLAGKEIGLFLGSQAWFPFLKTSRLRKRDAAVFAFSFGCAVSVCCEAAQIILIAHEPSVIDVIVRVFGSALGAGYLFLRAEPEVGAAIQFGEWRRQRAAETLTYALLLPASRALSPFVLDDWDMAMAQIKLANFVPFWTFFQKINIASLTNVFEVSLIYVPLAYVLYLKDRSVARASVLTLAAAELFELAQIPVLGRTFDITEGLYAGFVALATCQVVRTWTAASHRPRSQRYSPNPR